MQALWFFIACFAHRSVADFPAPQYVVDLDSKPVDRWGPLFKKQVELHGWDDSYGPVIDFMTGLLPMADWQRYDLELQALGLGLFGEEYFEEILGIHSMAKQIGVGDKVTIGMFVFFQLFYELVMECTGILARDAGGKVVHGRNMDIDLHVSNITAQVSWLRDGQEVLMTTQYLGYLGVHTGMRLGGWSVQANERTVLEFGPWGWGKSVRALDILALMERHRPVGYLLRETLLASSSFEDAVLTLSNAKSVSPLYFIIAGAKPGQGAVVTKSRGGLADAPRNRSVVLLEGSSSYFLAQTNWDNWIPITAEQCASTMQALPDDVEKACSEFLRLAFGEAGGCAELCGLASDGRREAAVAALDKMKSEEVDVDAILGVLSTAPVLANGTQFTSLMSPMTNEYRTVVREHASLSAPSEKLDRKRGQVAQILDRFLQMASSLSQAVVAV